MASLPPAAAAVPIEVTIETHGAVETWKRNFGGKTMRSTMKKRGGLLEERLGPTTFRFALVAKREAIDWRLVGVRSLRIPLPLAWFDRVSARESLEGNLSNEMWPGIPVMPIMSTGATDGMRLRNAGFPVYGVSGLFIEHGEIRIHGRDERLAVRSFYDGAEFLYRLVKAFGSGE